MARHIGCGSGLLCVKQRPLLTTRPSITCDILVSSTWHGTRFTARSIVEQKRVMRVVAQSGGSGHELYNKNAGQKGLNFMARVEKDKIAVSVSELRNQRNWFHIFRSSR
jgi:hypothetical protein